MIVQNTYNFSLRANILIWTVHSNQVNILIKVVIRHTYKHKWTYTQTYPLPSTCTRRYSLSQQNVQILNPDNFTDKNEKKKKKKKKKQPRTWRTANVHTIHICNTQRSFLKSSRLHDQSLQLFWLTSCHFTREWLHKFKPSPNPVILNEGPSHSHWHQNVEFSRVYHHTQFESNWFISIRMPANLEHIPLNITEVELSPRILIM